VIEFSFKVPYHAKTSIVTDSLE